MVAGGCYAVASGFAMAYLFRPIRSRERSVLLVTAAAGLCLTAALCVRGVRLGRLPGFGCFEALAWYALAVTGSYLYVAGRHETRALSAILLPYVTLLTGLGLLGVKTPFTVDPQIQSVWLGLHVVTAFVGYGLFTLEGILALAYLVQDWNLKHKRFGAVFHRFPSLETLDRLMIELISSAFLLLTLSIGLGIFLAHLNNWGAKWTTDPKVAASGATWLVYAILFHLRMSADRHGRRLALVAVFGFLCAMLTFVGVDLVSESMHDFLFTNPGLG